eukprot:8468196-Alexandrium_andersonii.AAC.1
MAEAPAMCAMLNWVCAVGCLIAPAPAARFKPAADASPFVAGLSVELSAPGAGSPRAQPAARLPWEPWLCH